MDKIGSDPFARSALYPHLGALVGKGDDAYRWVVSREQVVVAHGTINAHTSRQAMTAVRDAAVSDNIARPFSVVISQIFNVTEVPTLVTALDNGQAGEQPIE